MPCAWCGAFTELGRAKAAAALSSGWSLLVAIRLRGHGRRRNCVVTISSIVAGRMGGCKSGW